MAAEEQEYSQSGSDRALDPTRQLWANMFYHMYEQTRQFDPPQAVALANSYLQDEISWTEYLSAAINLCGDEIAPMSEETREENQFLADCIKAMKSNLP
jgi:hypothetical protein